MYMEDLEKKMENNNIGMVTGRSTDPSLNNNILNGNSEKQKTTAEGVYRTVYH